MSVVSNIEHS